MWTSSGLVSPGAGLLLVGHRSLLCRRICLFWVSRRAAAILEVL
jgi:hypothetical protein